MSASTTLAGASDRDTLRRRGPAHPGSPPARVKPLVACSTCSTSRPIGLHARDNDRLIDTLQSLKAKRNTLLVVEHDDVLMARADRIIDLGPGAGVHGGEVLANGTPAEIKSSPSSLTGLFLAKASRTRSAVVSAHSEDRDRKTEDRPDNQETPDLCLRLCPL